MAFDAEKYLRVNPLPADRATLGMTKDLFLSDDDIEKAVEKEGIINNVHYNYKTGTKTRTTIKPSKDSTK